MPTDQLPAPSGTPSTPAPTLASQLTTDPKHLRAPFPDPVQSQYVPEWLRSTLGPLGRLNTISTDFLKHMRARPVFNIANRQEWADWSNRARALIVSWPSPLQKLLTDSLPGPYATP